MDGGLFFRDLFEGQRFRSPVRNLTAVDTKRFAEEFDPQPVRGFY